MSPLLSTWESYCDEKRFQIGSGSDAIFWLFDDMTERVNANIPELIFLTVNLKPQSAKNVAEMYNMYEFSLNYTED